MEEVIVFLHKELGFEKLEVVRVGAEAVLVKGRIAGEIVIAKYRIRKLYRGRELDLKLRRERTSLEARLLARSSLLGVNVPQIVYVDASKGLLVMRFIDGTRLKNLVDKGTEANLLYELFEKVGAMVAVLHINGIVHGDLTTSNLLVTSDGRVWLIDFGLGFFSRRDEDRGTDIHLMLRVLESTHPSLSGKLFTHFMEGYRRVTGEDLARRVLERMHEIRMRGRYVATRRKSFSS